jgi:putative intracellular protease/amidase
MRIAIPLYDGFTALDAVGPYEVLSRLPGAQVRFVAAEPGPKTTESGSLTLVARLALADVPTADILVVPGGAGSRKLLHDEELIPWIRKIHATTRWTTSVCTGSLLLGAAGILRGLEATTHWLAMDLLAGFGAIPVSRRVVVQGKVITAAGVSSGIDMALHLAALAAGEDVARAILLSIEYDPEPPFDAGSVGKAPAHVVQMVREASARRIGGGGGKGEDDHVSDIPSRRATHEKPPRKM